MNKCSRNPQDINEHVWYYEEPTFISLIVEKKFFANCHEAGALELRISRRKLEASLKRMNASRRKR